MNKKLYILLITLLVTATAFAQAPDKMSYQAIVRNSGGDLVSSQPVGMQISILQTSTSGTAVFVETHTPTTNINGLVTLEIGTGTLVSGDFTSIDWPGDTYFIKTDTDPTGDSNYTISGTSQMLSVPYALHAKTAERLQAPTYTVNTFYPELGGYVIEVSASGKHGLVVAMQDQGISSFYLSKNVLSNAANHDVDGAEFKDWRLPTIRELSLMYQVFINGNGADLNEFEYRSSMEHNNDLAGNFEPTAAWVHMFAVNYQITMPTFMSLPIRAVRAF